MPAEAEADDYHDRELHLLIVSSSAFFQAGFGAFGARLSGRQARKNPLVPFCPETVTRTRGSEPK
jgi:hypothetical protein